jgi:hypothetical protein
MDSIDDLIDVLRQRLAHARRAKKLFANDPAVAGQVARAIASAPLLPDRHDPPQGRKTVWQRLHEHFETTGNQWIGIAELATATGLSKPNVCQEIGTATYYETADPSPK